MLQEQEDVFYYVTVTNENDAQPSMPEGVEEGIRRGMYCLERLPEPQVRLLAAGPVLKEAIGAAALLKEKQGIDAEVWSVTSYTELARDGIASQRSQRLGLSDAQPYATRVLGDSHAPVIAASDYVRAVAESIRAFVPGAYVTLGTDGFGRSDTRAALRAFFEVDAKSIALAALAALAHPSLARARQVYGIDDALRPPWER